MKKLRKKRIKGSVLAAIISGALAAILLLSIFIADLFIPVRYLSAYLVKGKYSRPDGVEITFLDVGFGDCAYVSFPDGKNMLIDGGNGDYANNLKILKFLNVNGVNTIDYLVCTSVKDEHSDGLSEIVKYKKVKCAFIPYVRNMRITDGYNSLVTQLKKRGVEYTYASVGEGVLDEEHGYFITFLSPTNYLSSNSEYATLNNKANTENIDNASSVVWLEYGDNAVIFTSDVRPEALERIVLDYQLCASLGATYCNYMGRNVQLTKCNVVTSPAHAGERNTSSKWYEFIQPEQVIVSVGKSFADYPSIEAVSDMQGYCDPLYTSYSGNITVTLGTQSYRITEQK